MKQTIIATLMTVFSFASMAAIDLTAYDLTEIQIELMDKFEKRGFDDEKLHKMASALQKANNRADHKEYIPPYEKEDLEALKTWALGDAFYTYSEAAGVTFDKIQYREDCPNWALFGFLRATGTEYIKFDILLGHLNMNFALNYAFTNKSAETFKEIYMQYAEDNGFAKYITIN